MEGSWGSSQGSWLTSPSLPPNAPHPLKKPEAAAQIGRNDCLIYSFGSCTCAGAAHGKPITDALNSSSCYEECQTQDAAENFSFRFYSALRFFRHLGSMLSARWCESIEVTEAWFLSLESSSLMVNLDVWQTNFQPGEQGACCCRNECWENREGHPFCRWTQGRVIRGGHFLKVLLKPKDEHTAGCRNNVD